MRRIILVVVVAMLARWTQAQKITPDGAALSQVYWDASGIADTFGVSWQVEGSPSLVAGAFGYTAGGAGFSGSDFWYEPPYSVWDFTAPECATSECGSPAFTAVLAFTTSGATGTRFLLSDVTYGSGDGWYLAVTAPRRVQFRAFGLMDSENVYATDMQGLDVGTGLQVVCFGLDVDMTPRLKANGRAMVSGEPGSGFVPSYGDSFIGIHDAWNSAWRPAAWETYFEIYLTRTPITVEVCESLEAEVRS
jgi:hypothetical protein